MPDPASLPRELFGIVLNHVIRQYRDAYGTPEKRYDPAHLPPGISKRFLDAVKQRRPEARSEERLLYDLCCIGRRWREMVQPTLYETFTYRGERQSLRDLWLYLRTMISNPGLAASVKHLEIRAWGCWTIRLDKRKAENQLKLSDVERDELKAAMCGAGFDEKQEIKMFKAIEEDADRTPLMAILLTRLPNLKSVRAHAPPWCDYLNVIFKKAIETEEEHGKDHHTRYRAFQKLSRAEFFSEGSYSYEDHPDVDYYDLSLEYMWPIFYLPQLTVLGLYDLSTVCVAELYEDTHRHTSPVVDLTLVLHQQPSIATDDLWTLLDLPETLNKLRISVVKSWDVDPVPILKRRLWPALERFKDKLSHLDIHEHVLNEWRKWDEAEEIKARRRQAAQPPPYCCPLRSFSSLKRLAIIPDLLLGDNCEHQKLESGHLPAHLPDQLAMFTLYDSNSSPVIQEDWDSYLEAYVRHKGETMEMILIDQNFVENMPASRDTGISGYELFGKAYDACDEEGVDFLIGGEPEDGLEDGGRLTEVYTDTKLVRKHIEYLATPKEYRSRQGEHHVNTLLEGFLASSEAMEQDDVFAE